MSKKSTQARNYNTMITVGCLLSLRNSKKKVSSMELKIREAQRKQLEDKVNDKI